MQHSSKMFQMDISYPSLTALEHWVLYQGCCMLAPWPLALPVTTLKAIIINDSDQPGFLLTNMDENGRNTMATSMVISEGGP